MNNENGVPFHTLVQSPIKFAGIISTYLEKDLGYYTGIKLSKMLCNLRTNRLRFHVEFTNFSATVTKFILGKPIT